MKAIVFAGGAGTRLWPLSRRSSPKQFEKVIGDKSTLQLAVEKLLPNFNWNDIYVATAERYLSIIADQLPKLPKGNVIGEPEPRDVGPAVGLLTSIFYRKYRNDPVLILWSDHIVKKRELFAQVLKVSGEIIKKNKDKIIFISQKPRFASQNLGWIKFGGEIVRNKNIVFHSFESFHYRPNLDKALEYFKSGNFAWNLGYFVTTPSFLWKLYQTYQPEIFEGMKKIYETVGKSTYKATVRKVYPSLPKISFDNAILEKINKENALVISEDLGWSDIGAWEALKEALQLNPAENVIKGKVLLTDCHDSLVYNYTDALVVAIDLDGFMVVNTHDVIMVCHKNSVPKIKKLVERLAESENEHLV